MSHNLMFEWIGLIISLLCSAFFSAAETALTSMSKLHIKKAIEHQGKDAAVLEKWVKNSDSILIFLLIGNTLVNICAASLGTIIVTDFLGDSPVGRIAAITTGIMTFIVLVFSEITPKTFAKQHSEKISLLVIGFLDVLSHFFIPVIFLFKIIAKFIIKILGGKLQDVYTPITEEEIMALVNVGSKEGALEKEECEMIHGVMEFSDTMVSKIMWPRVEMRIIKADASLKQGIEFIVATGYSRIPVYEGTIDNIVGILYCKDVLKYFTNDNSDLEKIKVKDIMRKPCFVSTNKKLDDVLREFQRQHMHMGIVVDEYGGTAGLVTFEDLLEEIVGDIQDEYDNDTKRGELIKILDEKTAIVKAKISIDELNKLFELNLPEETSYDSLGGFITSITEVLPKKGDVIDYKNILLIEILEANEKRVSKVKIQKKEQEKYE